MKKQFSFIDQELLKKEIKAKELREVNLKKQLKDLRAELKNLRTFLEEQQ